MTWPHHEDGWSKLQLGSWFLQYALFSQWSRPRHTITLFHASIDPYHRPGLPSERFLLAGLALVGFCFHFTLCRKTWSGIPTFTRTEEP